MKRLKITLRYTLPRRVLGRLKIIQEGIEEVKINPHVYTNQEGIEEVENNPWEYKTQEGTEEVKNNPQVYTTQESTEEVKPSGIHYPRGY